MNQLVFPFLMSDIWVFEEISRARGRACHHKWIMMNNSGSGLILLLIFAVFVPVLSNRSPWASDWPVQFSDWSAGPCELSLALSLQGRMFASAIRLLTSQTQSRPTQIGFPRALYLSTLASLSKTLSLDKHCQLLRDKSLLVIQTFLLINGIHSEI